MEKFILIDGNSLLNRAFYATPLFTTKDGLPTNGVFGFVKLILKIIADKKPTYFAVAFDLHAPTFRHKLYDEYKAGRKPMPQELVPQVSLLKEVLKTMQIKTCELAGFEADDIIGTLAKKFDVQTYIYTGDRDAYQLVDGTTSVCFTRKGVSDILELTSENFKDEIGLTPSQIIDLKALMGDKSDNIPGVAGIGEKSAYSLIEKYGDIEGVYAHIDELGGAMHRKLVEGKENAFFSKRLATIDVQVPLDISLQDCLLRMPFKLSVREKFAELEFKSLVSKDIFKEENSEEIPKEISIKETRVEELFPADADEAIAIIQKTSEDRIACDWTDGGFRFFFPSNAEVQTEYVLPLKTGLLDVGFFDYQLNGFLKSLFSCGKRIVAYNVKAMMHRAAQAGIDLVCAYDDVSILKCIADGLGNSDGLDFCIQYNGLPEKNKAYGVYRLWEIYLSSLNEQEKKLYQEVELPLVGVLFDMERQGVRIDTDALQSFSQKYHAELSDLVEKIYELAGERFNVNSTQQLGKILFEKLRIGAGIKKNKESKNYKTTAEELEKYAEQSEIVRYLLRYRKIQKLVSTYIDGFKPLIVEGRVHTTYNQSNTQTGRLSSVNPNLQNIPIRTEEGRELRKLFLASEGNVLIDADYSQIELRLLAHFSQCKELREAFCSEQDVHSITASQVFNVPLENVTPQMRREAKAVNFGIIYGISAFGLSNDLSISTKKAQEYIDKYFASYSDVKKYMNENVERAKTSGFITTLLGRKRVINEIKASNHNLRAFGERAAMNMPLQGSSADIIKIAMINVAKKLKNGNFKAKLVLQVHDELLIDCPKNELKEVKEILRNEMENAVSLSVPLTVDVNCGNSWFETK